MTRARNIGLSFAALLFFAAPAYAADVSFEDGLYAYQVGNTKEAARIFWRVVNDDPRAQYYLATMLDAGEGMGKDVYSAAGWFRKSANAGYVPAMVAMGYAYSAGHGVTKNDASAREWYGKAAQQGDAVAQNNLGMMLRDGTGGAKDPAVAMKWFLLSAQQGNARAQYNLGALYHEGLGVPQNDIEALHWYQAAALQGDVYAQYALGDVYRLGQGVSRDAAEARRWYQRAAEKNYAPAQAQLARLYERGEGGQKSPENAAIWYSRAAQSGFTYAQYRLGMYYEKGFGLPADLAQARVWYKKSVDEGKYVSGMGALCRLYARPDSGIKIDDALNMYRRGASAGDPYCQLELARLYRVGVGVEKDMVAAYQWFALAATALPEGDDKATAVVTRIEISNALSEQELTDARQRVGDWKPKDPG